MGIWVEDKSMKFKVNKCYALGESKPKSNKNLYPTLRTAYGNLKIAIQCVTAVKKG